MANIGKGIGAFVEELGAGKITQGAQGGQMMYLIAAADKEHARKVGLAQVKGQQDVLGKRFEYATNLHKELVKEWGSVLASGNVVPPDLMDKITESAINMQSTEHDWLSSVGIKPKKQKDPDFTPFSLSFQQNAILNQGHLEQIRKEMDKGKYTEIDDLLDKQTNIKEYSRAHQKMIRDKVIKDIKALSIKDFKIHTAAPDSKDLPVSERGVLDSTGKEQVRRAAAIGLGAPSDVGARLLNLFPNAAEYIQEWWTGEEQDPLYQYSAAYPEADDTMRNWAGAEDFYRWLGGEGWFGGQGAGMASPTGSTGPGPGGPGGMRGSPRGMGNPESLAAEAAGASMASMASMAQMSGGAADSNVPFESDPAAAAEARIASRMQQGQGGAQQAEATTQQTLTQASPDDVAIIKRFIKQLQDAITRIGSQEEAVLMFEQQFRNLSPDQQQLLLSNKQIGALFKQFVR